jgi:predicted lipoprotein
MTSLRTILQQVLLLLLLAVLLFSGCTIKKLEEVDQGKSTDDYSTWTKSGKAFNPVEYVDSIWDETFIPAYLEESSDIVAVLSALSEDQITAVQKFGLPQDSGESLPVFKVKGNANVLEYDDSSRNGLLLLDLCPYDGKVDISLQVGPVVKDTALRDSVSFISFTDVGNQLHFANLADELNNRMKQKVIEPLDLENIEGTTICFYGAIKLNEGQSLETLVVTPVQIDVVAQDGGNNDD